jgi:hypothetical protein
VLTEADATTSLADVLTAHSVSAEERSFLKCGRVIIELRQ